ncbi:transmembrane protein 211-like [Labeo rohita]|uniref:Transmembrane protein 211-like n=1 Tax=Labeo rohita TaxID=84645 RepID=A0A498MT71_LABRO|nr:transmembrane protein 211-like [Labeo rohita]
MSSPLGPQGIVMQTLETSAVLCSGGCALLAVSSLLAIITIFLPSGACERRICTLAGYMQMAAGFWK